MSPVIYLLSNGACLGAGFLIGRLTRAVEQLAATKLITDVSKGAAMERKPRRIRLRFEHYVAVFLVLLGIFTAVQSQRQSACTRDYANSFADALDARSSSSATAQTALDELMTTVGQLTSAGQAGGPDAAMKFRAALADYLNKRAAAKEQQQRNPYPPAPRDLCK